MCVEYCIHDFTNFNDFCLKRNTSCRPIFLIRKNRLNLFFHNNDLCSVKNMNKILLNCIYLKISLEKLSIENPKPWPAR